MDFSSPHLLFALLAPFLLPSLVLSAMTAYGLSSNQTQLGQRGGGRSGRSGKASGRGGAKEELDSDRLWEVETSSVKMDILFSNITMAVGGVENPILDDISGTIKAGSLFAIMGPSGCGKTSLLNAIAGRVPDTKKGAKKGGVRLSGRRSLVVGDDYAPGSPPHYAPGGGAIKLKASEKLPAAFVKQEDIFFPYMTVRETLSFRVKLKWPKRLGSSAVNDYVATLIDGMALTKCADTIVGNDKVRGISGGERKRLSIACQLLSSPQLLFLDEPTSGLDSYQAEKLVKILKRLAQDEGKTIVSSAFSALCACKINEELLANITKPFKTVQQTVAHGAGLRHSPTQPSRL